MTWHCMSKVGMVVCLACAAMAALGPTEALAQQKGTPVKPSASGSLDGQSKRVKINYKKETSVDFNDTAIDGSAKNPFLSMLSSRDQEFNRGFVKIRYNWHDQLIMSVSGLNQ